MSAPVAECGGIGKLILPQLATGLPELAASGKAAAIWLKLMEDFTL